LPPFLGRRSHSLRSSTSALHYYTKTQYNAILLKKSLILLKKNHLDACRPGEVPEDGRIASVKPIAGINV
jgi:hypothetical protein